MSAGDATLKEKVKNAFRDVYGEHTKTIACDKLERVLKYLNPSFTQAELHRLFKVADGATTGVVSYEEFVDFLAGGEPKEEAASAANAQTADDEFGEDHDDAAAEMAKIRAMRGKPRRASVSATRVTSDQVRDYKRPVHPKDEAGRVQIKECLKENEKLSVLFGHLDREQLGQVVDAFYLKEFPEGVDIIMQGEDGDCLYIIAEGAVDVFVARPSMAEGKIAPGDRGSKVASFGVGMIVGELALMYGAPRAATVATAGIVKTWVLDSTDFKMLLQSSGQATYAKYEGWLSEVELLNSFNHFELAKLADIMQSNVYDEGEVILAQGEAGDKFYILEDGACDAFISGDEGEKLVCAYESVGDYFGEIALLTEEPRRATVRAADGGCSVAYISKEDFTAVLGPIAEKLKDKVDQYPQYAEFLTS